MTRIIVTEAIVFKKRPLLNKDHLYIIFTKTRGKIPVFAKGVKKITSRRSPHLQTSNLIEAYLYERQPFYYLQKTELISGFSKIKENHGKSNILYTALFVLERILPENQEETKIYTALKHFLVDLSISSKFSAKHLNMFLNKVVKILGFINETKTNEELFSTIEDIIHEKVPRFNI